MLNLLSHLYMHYARISAADLAEKKRKLRETFNPEKPLESLYTRINECVHYVTAADDPIA